MSGYRDENERMLATALGLAPEEAAQRLKQAVAIVAAEDSTSQALAYELHAQLARTVHVAPSHGAADLEVAIGRSGTGRAARTLFVDVDENGLRVSSLAPATRGNLLADKFRLTFAGCYAAAPVLRHLLQMGSLGYTPTRNPFVVKFASLGIPDDIFDLPLVFADTALAGAGAIGNGFLRALRHLPVEGVLPIVDPKLLGAGNANRCLYFAEDEPVGPKAELLAMRAQPDFSSLRLEPHVQTFSDYVRVKGRVRRVIVATDSRRVRRAIQSDLPLEVVDASTTDIREIVVHSHRQPTHNACLACIYRHIREEQTREREIARGLGIDFEDVAQGLISVKVARKIVESHPDLDAKRIEGMAFDSLFRQRCAEQQLLTATGIQVLSPFAFVSNLAGALLALELTRLARDGDDPMRPNYMFLSPWSPPNARARLTRPRHFECSFCARPQNLMALRTVWADHLRDQRPAPPLHHDISITHQSTF